MNNLSQTLGFDTFNVEFSNAQLWLVILGLLGALIIFAFVFHLIGFMFKKSDTKAA